MGHTRGSTLAKWSWPIPTSCIAGCDLEWRWTVHIYVRVSNPYIHTCSKLRMKAIDSNIQWNCTWYNGECITNSILQMNHWVQYLFPCFAMICSLLAAEHTSLWSLHTPVLSANGAINLNHTPLILTTTPLILSTHCTDETHYYIISSQPSTPLHHGLRITTSVQWRSAF